MGTVKIRFTRRARDDLADLQKDPSTRKRLKAVQKALGLLETNQRHPSLHTHLFRSYTGPKGEPVFEAYAENKTPAAYRVFWYWGPNPSEITILAITAHP